MLISIIVLIALVVIIGMMSGGDNNDQPANNTVETATLDEPPMVVSTRELDSDYDDNKAAAGQKYKGKILEVSGIVASIDSSVGDQAIVQLVGKNEFQTVSTQGNNDFTQYATTLKKGQNVVLICEGDGALFGFPQLNNCQPK
ncbi:OB-fold putative lipoprotein [Moraxella catarrhalis]|uniref:OB-fold putative lipoprotein n=1 Tax=Moraxella catarrhalis TaxID=480 RepID=UPI0022283988